MNNHANTNLLPNRKDSPLFYVNNIREMELALFADQDSFVIMQKAGSAVFTDIIKILIKRPSTKIHIVLGCGNNAGDGLVLTALLQQAGYKVTAYRLFDKPFYGDAAKAFIMAKRSGATICQFKPFICQDGDIIVEAIFGIGLDRPTVGLPLVAIKHINNLKTIRANITVYAIDIAAGIMADNGIAVGTSIQADKTITFIADKIGLHTADGRKASGEVIVNTLGACLPRTANNFLYDYTPDSKITLDKSNVHKGNFGHTLVVGGNTGMFGATALAAISCLKVGTGKTSIYSHPDYNGQYYVEKTPIYEVMKCSSLHDLTIYSALVLGPGLGRDAWGNDTFKQILKQHDSTKPLLIDADGLYHLANTKEKLLPDIAVITPHEAEAAILLQTNVSDICQNKPDAVLKLAKKYACIAVLKGSGTLISDGQRIWINRTGNINLATAGSGDTLSGIISGYLAQGINALDASLYGVYRHGLAADEYAQKHPRKSMRASEIWNYL